MKQTKLGKGKSRPITRYDEILNFILTPADFPIRSLWELAKQNNVDRQIGNTLLDLVIPIYEKIFYSMFNLKVTGKENIAVGKKCIISANHSSWLDAQLLGTMLPQRAYFLAKKELLKMPISGVFMEAIGGIAIDRDYVDPKGLKKALGLLKKNEHLVIFPEGTIPGEEDLSRDHIDPTTGLLHGNPGAVILAIKSHSPIVPVGIVGADEILPPETFPKMETLPQMKQVELKLNIGEPIHYDKYYHKKVSEELADELTHDLMKKIGRLAGKKQKEHKEEHHTKSTAHKKNT